MPLTRRGEGARACLLLPRDRRSARAAAAATAVGHRGRPPRSRSTQRGEEGVAPPPRSAVTAESKIFAISRDNFSSQRCSATSSAESSLTRAPSRRRRADNCTGIRQRATLPSSGEGVGSARTAVKAGAIERALPHRLRGGETQKN